MVGTARKIGGKIAHGGKTGIKKGVRGAKRGINSAKKDWKRKHPKFER